MKAILKNMEKEEQLLLSYEVDGLVQVLEEFRVGNIDDIMTVEFAEPDMEMVIDPENDRLEVKILMFGFGKSNSQDVRLTEKEIKELKKNMSRSELKEFEKRQKQAEADRDWNMFMMADFLDDED